MSYIEGSWDSDLVMLQNPSMKEFRRVYATVDRSHGEGMRAIIFGSSLYTWDGYYANHDEIRKALSLKDGDGMDLHLWTDYPELDVSYLSNVLSLEDHADLDAVKEQRIIDMCQKIRENKIIHRIYKNSFDIKIEDGFDEYWSSSIEG